VSDSVHLVADVDEKHEIRVEADSVAWAHNVQVLQMYVPACVPSGRLLYMGPMMMCEVLIEIVASIMGLCSPSTTQFSCYRTSSALHWMQLFA
jgi:hypothetical protein